MKTKRPTTPSKRPVTSGSRPSPKPGAAKPSAAKPGDAKPSASKPSAAKPGDAKPSAAKPGASVEQTVASRLPSRPNQPRPKTTPARSPATQLADLESAPTTTFLPKGPDEDGAASRRDRKTPRRQREPSTRSDGPLRGPAPTVVAQIRELEAQLDRLIDEASRRDLASLAGTDDDNDESDLEITRSTGTEALASADREDGPSAVSDRDAATPRSAPPDVPSAQPSVPIARPSAPESRTGLAADATVFDTARELLSSDFYLRKWGRVAMRGRSEEVDDFGFDPIYEQKARTVLEFLYTRYFRVETTGIEHVPAHGRCLLVANHSGTLPLDGVMIKTAVKLEHAAPRDVRWLTEDFIYHMPYLGSIMNRLGAVRACQENAERLLGKEMLCAVFPEGVKGIGKLFAERYRLQRFGRGGFIKLCLRTNTPIIPVAVVGAEETNPLLFRIEYLSKALGLPYVPVTPTFPALGPLGLLPAPTKWQIHFGEPIDIGGYGRDAADDDLLVGKLAERVRSTIQGMLDRAIGARKSVFFG